MLVQIWCTLRLDDSKAIDPSAIVPYDSYWSLQLERTKSTGPGRRRNTVFAYLSRAAHFVVPSWSTTFMYMSS